MMMMMIRKFLFIWALLFPCMVFVFVGACFSSKVSDTRLTASQFSTGISRMPNVMSAVVHNVYHILSMISRSPGFLARSDCNLHLLVTVSSCPLESHLGLLCQLRKARTLCSLDDFIGARISFFFGDIVSEPVIPPLNQYGRVPPKVELQKICYFRGI